MTDEQVSAKIHKIVRVITWYEITKVWGINVQQAQKIRAGKTVKFRKATLDRLRPRFEKRA